MSDNSKHIRYIYFINRQIDYSIDIIKKHVEYLKHLDKIGQLDLCGPFQDYPGGMVILKAKSIEEAKIIAESDPFITEGFANFELRIWELSNEENNHLL